MATQLANNLNNLHTVKSIKTREINRKTHKTPQFRIIKAKSNVFQYEIISGWAQN